MPSPPDGTARDLLDPSSRDRFTATVLAMSPAGPPQLLQQAQEDGARFLAEMGVITGRKRMATVKAADRLDALRIGAAELENFLLHQPRVALSMMKSLVERLREVQERIDAWAGVW